MLLAANAPTGAVPEPMLSGTGGGQPGALGWGAMSDTHAPGTASADAGRDSEVDVANEYSPPTSVEDWLLLVEDTA